MTPLQREVLEEIAAGNRRPQNRHASRAVNQLFRLDYLTDVDPVDNRHAIGGCYITPAGRKALASPVHSGMKIHKRIFRERAAFGGSKTGSLCGRLNNGSSDGMNITDDDADVTCAFCRKHPRFSLPSGAATKSNSDKRDSK